MTFKCYTLIRDEVCPSYEDFEYIGEGKKRHFKNDFIYEFTLRFASDRFILFGIDYDDQKYRDTVYNIETEEEDKNPKKPTQIELKQQFFACYDTDKHELYISDPQKKGALKDFLQDKWQKKVMIRARISSAKEFEETVHSIRKVTYTQTRNLVTSHPESIFAQRYDPLGLDIPDRLKTTLEYESKLDAIPLRSKIREIFDRNHKYEIESIEILGEDESGIMQTFNLETIIKEFSISIEPDEDKRYDMDLLFQLLLLKLEGAHVSET